MIPPNISRLLRRIGIPAGIALSVSGALGLTLFSNISLTFNLFSRDINITTGDITINAPDADEETTSEPSSPEIVFNPVITITMPDVVFTPEILVDNTDSTNIEFDGSDIQLNFPSPEVPDLQFDPNIDIDNNNQIDLQTPVSLEGEMPWPQLYPPNKRPKPEVPLAIALTQLPKGALPGEPASTLVPKAEPVKAQPQADGETPLPVQTENPSDGFEPTRLDAEPALLKLVPPDPNEARILPTLQRQPMLAAEKIPETPFMLATEKIPETPLRAGLAVCGGWLLLRRRGKRSRR